MQAILEASPRAGVLAIDSLPMEEQALLSVRLAARQYAPGETIFMPGLCSDCFFVESGLVSIQFGEEPVEIALVGSGGFLNFFGFLGSEDVRHRAVAVTACRMRRVDAAELRAVCDATPELRTHLHRYLRSRMAEAMEAAACHLRHPLEKRLASWIATATELLGCEEISVTHAELARLLGVRRPTMTLALQAIEGAGAIRASRGRLIVRDRSGLRRLACRCLAAPRITLSQPVGSDSGGSA